MKLIFAALLVIAGALSLKEFLLPYGNGGWFVLTVVAWLAAGILALSVEDGAHG